MWRSLVAENACLAQLVEHSTDTRKVLGSIPRARTKIMQDYKAYFAGKKITLMGLGLLGRGVGDARFLAECGVELVVTDMKNEEELTSSVEQLRHFSNITFHFGGHQLEDFQGKDLILKAAGVPLDSVFIAEAKKNSIPVRMSADLFTELSGAMVVGVTGTRGKSTVSHILAHILKADGRKVLLGGNVRGVSTLSLLPEVTNDSVAVLELDSWQLQGWGEARMSPHIAVFTTFMPDHMNYYKHDMRAYFADKAYIFTHQKEVDVLVLSEQVASYAREYGYVENIQSKIIVASTNDIPSDWHVMLPGEHNKLNIGIAIATARALGVRDEKIKEAVESFSAVKGRLELFGEIRGIKIYNDNNATTPDATIAALHALGNETSKSIILIMGGANKGLYMNELIAEIPRYCKKVLLLAGTGSERIHADIPNTSIYRSISKILDDALASASAGDVILFSPAFASFGMFANEYERNDQFIEEVKKRM